MDVTEGDRLIFLFAHPDDDVFICGTMWELLRKGTEVNAAWLTSGGLLGGSKTREAELHRAMKILGLEKARIHLARFPDLGLVSELDRAADYAAELMHEIRPTRIFATAFEGGHPDHDSVNFLAYEGSVRAGLEPEIYEFPLYNGSGRFHYWKWRINSFPDNSPQTLYNPLTDEAITVKLRMIRRYPSQWMYMTPARLACSRSRMKNPGEPYRRCPIDRDHTRRPHQGTLNYERWFNAFMRIRFQDFAEAVGKVSGKR